MITPGDITTVSVGQLPSSPFNLSDELPHEVGTDLNRGTVQNLADVIGAYLGTSSGVGFRAVQVNDGEMLPATTQQEFILVGKGTFFNVGGGPEITTTEELNALVSNGTYWFIGVEIDVSVALSDHITQQIRTGFLNTTPSEDAVFNALADKVNSADLNNFTVTDFIVSVDDTQEFTLPAGHKALSVHLDGYPQYRATSNNVGFLGLWSETDNIVTLTTPTIIGNYIYIVSQ